MVVPDIEQQTALQQLTVDTVELNVTATNVDDRTQTLMYVLDAGEAIVVIVPNPGLPAPSIVKTTPLMALEPFVPTMRKTFDDS